MEADIRDIAKVLSLTAALLVVGCGSDDQSYNYGPFFPGGNPPPGAVAPVAVADSFSVLGNGILTGSVTGNDTLNGAVVTAFQNPSTSGGTVLVNAAGQLAYTPPAGQTNISDTFTYTLSNSAGSSTATVTVAVGGRGLFVKNDVVTTGTGTQASPFKTLLEATTAAAGINGAQVVVFRGDGTSTGQNVPVTLTANQAIVAQDTANQPTISAPITLASNTTLANLRLIGSTGANSVSGTSLVGATFANLTVSNTTGNGINITNPSGVVALTGIVMGNIGQHALPLNINSNGLNLTVSNLQVNNTTANVSLAEITGTSVVNASFDNVTCTNIGTIAPFNIGFDWNTRNTANCTLAVSNYRFDTGGSGMFFVARDMTSTAVLISNANVTNATDIGTLLRALDSSTLKTRVTNSRFLGNALGFRATTSSVLASNLSARLLGNMSDTYELINASTGLFRVENLAGFATDNPVGALTTVGAVQNAVVGSLGIP